MAHLRHAKFQHRGSERLAEMGLPQRLQASNLLTIWKNDASICSAICSSLLDDAVLRTVGKSGEIVRTVLCDHQDVLLAVAAGAGLALGNHDHRLHRDDYIGLEDSLDILAQLQPASRP